MHAIPTIRFLLTAAVAIAVTACRELTPGAPPEDSLLDGPMEGLSHEEQHRFLDGDIAFNDQVFATASGLGPVFVATSCGGCHAGDGKGHPFTTLVRFGQTRPGVPPDYSIGGPQLQNRALPGYRPETIPEGTPFMRLTPPAVTGLGLLAALTDEQILALADPDDADGDGISGVPCYVTPPPYFVPQWFHQESNGRYVGRFGKKAAAIDLLHQTVGAYSEDMGIASTFRPEDTYSGLTIDPEVTDATVRAVVFYLRTLKAPIQRTPDDPVVRTGKQVFTAIQCGGCHVPEWTTPRSDIPALSNRTFYPYTDLLLHDMGPALDDGVTEGSAETYEWRTPPLWGLGLSPNSQGGTYYLMHDGRARSIEQAIMLHGGEAEESRRRFEALSTSDKVALIRFLESL